MIKPTVGRVVLFQPSKPSDRPLLDQPFAATIAYVWGDRMVNLSYVDKNGTAGNATSVTLLQDDDVGSDRGHFAYWMPYQVEQADKSAKEAEHGIKAGDTVRLRSGGPVMVVESVSGARVDCRWDGNGVDVCGHSFKAPMLDKLSSVEAAGATPSPPSVIPRIRVVTDGRLTKVYDDATGDEIKFVQALRMEHHKGGRMYARVETLARVESATVVSDAEVAAVSLDAAWSKGPVWDEGPVTHSSGTTLTFGADGGDIGRAAKALGAVAVGSDKTEGLDIGEAVWHLNEGRRVARLAWGDVWLALSPGTPALQADKFWAGPNRDYAASLESGTAHVLPSVTMKLETGEIVMGWAANPVDLLARDWCVV